MFLNPRVGYNFRVQVLGLRLWVGLLGFWLSYQVHGAVTHYGIFPKYIVLDHLGLQEPLVKGCWRHWTVDGYRGLNK